MTSAAERSTIRGLHKINKNLNPKKHYNAAPALAL